MKNLIAAMFVLSAACHVEELERIDSPSIAIVDPVTSQVYVWVHVLDEDLVPVTYGCDDKPDLWLAVSSGQEPLPLWCSGASVSDVVGFRYRAPVGDSGADVTVMHGNRPVSLPMRIYWLGPEFESGQIWRSISVQL